MELGLFSKYRSSLMGFATILIILCHAPANGVILPVILSKILQFGGIGVDIFLLVSGFGMYYSLESFGSNGNLLIWYKRRYLRILVPYLLFTIPVYAVPYIVEENVVHLLDNNCGLLLEYISKVSTLSYWTNGWGLWFVALLLPLYLVTPILYIIQDCILGKVGLILLISLIICSQCFFKPENLVLLNIQSCLVRVPSFIIGILLGSLIRKSIYVSLKFLLAPFFLFLFCVCLNRLTGVYFGNQFMLALPLSVLFIKVINVIKCKTVINFFNFFGLISLESYCTNVFVVRCFFFFSASSALYFNNIPNYILSTCICIIISYCMNIMSAKILRLTIR